MLGPSSNVPALKLGTVTLVPPASLAYTSGSGASTNVDGFGVQVLAPLTAVGYAIRRWRQNTGGVASKGKASGVVNLSEPVVFGARLSVYPVVGGGTGSDANSVFRFRFGTDLADLGGELARKGFGVKSAGFGTPLKLVVHDGTTLTEVSSSFTPSVVEGASGDSFDCAVESLGTGRVNLWVNGAIVATTTAGPTGDTAQFKSNLEAVAENVATLTGSRLFAIITNPWLVLK